MTGSEEVCVVIVMIIPARPGLAPLFNVSKKLGR